MLATVQSWARQVHSPKRKKRMRLSPGRLFPRHRVGKFSSHELLIPSHRKLKQTKFKFSFVGNHSFQPTHPFSSREKKRFLRSKNAGEKARVSSELVLKATWEMFAPVGRQGSLRRSRCVRRPREERAAPAAPSHAAHRSAPPATDGVTCSISFGDLSFA